MQNDNVRHAALSILDEKLGELLNIVGFAIVFNQLDRNSRILVGLISAFAFYRLIVYSKKIWLQVKEKNIPLILDVGDDEEYLDSMRDTAYQAMRGKNFDPKVYDREFDIEKEDMAVHRESTLTRTEKEWTDLIKRFEKRLFRLNSKLRGQKNFHIFLKCPAAMAVGMGAVNGTKNAVVLYHYIDSRYEPVIDLHCSADGSSMGSHQLKNRVDPPFKYIGVEEPARLNSCMYIALDLASHSTLAGVKKLAEQTDASVVMVKNAYNNTLSIEEDWLLAAREVITVIMKWASKPEVNCAELFISAPLPLAFAIGMGVGTQSLIKVNHWFREENAYSTVFELNKL